MLINVSIRLIGLFNESIYLYVNFYYNSILGVSPLIINQLAIKKKIPGHFVILIKHRIKIPPLNLYEYHNSQ